MYRFHCPYLSKKYNDHIEVNSERSASMLCEYKILTFGNLQKTSVAVHFSFSKSSKTAENIPYDLYEPCQYNQTSVGLIEQRSAF